MKTNNIVNIWIPLDNRPKTHYFEYNEIANETKHITLNTVKTYHFICNYMAIKTKMSLSIHIVIKPICVTLNLTIE